MSESDDEQREQEKTKSFTLGHVSQLEVLSEELRSRAGDAWADASSRVEIEKARQLKSLAEEFEERAQDLRAQRDDRYTTGDGRDE